MKNPSPGRRKFIKTTTFATMSTYFLSCRKVTREDKSKSGIPYGDTGVPYDLRCEFLSHPVGIVDESPRLSWKIKDSRRGARQTACQIQVASQAAMYFVLLVVFCLSGEANSDTLRGNFAAPHGDARPHIWLRWMDGNISAEGMRKDMVALEEVGISGLTLFSLGNHAPEGSVAFLSPEWEEIFRQSIEAASEHNIEFSVFNSEGWATSGGPWITPELSMQMVTWSEMTLQGGKQVDIKLPMPSIKEDFYREIAILAVPERPFTIKRSIWRKRVACGRCWMAPESAEPHLRQNSGSIWVRLASWLACG